MCPAERVQFRKCIHLEQRGLDALVLAQLSSFDRPNLGEPPGVPKVKQELQIGISDLRR